MRQMKDSGIEWIGEIPESWKTIKNKYLFSLRSGESISKEDLVEDGIYPVYGGGDIIGHYNRYNVENKSFLIGRVGARCGCITPINSLCWATDNALIADSPNINDYYIYAEIAANLNTLNESNAQPLITATKVLNVTIPNPLLHEQQSISAYLDRQCAHIDNVIEKTKASIEEYKKLRQAVITQAVTKGVRGDRPMKDSGVEFIGNIPANWEIERLKFILSEIVDCPHETPNYSPDGEYLVIRTADEDYGFLRSTENMYRLDKAEYENRTRRLLLEKDDIVYGREGERWGLACLVPESNKYCLGQRMMQFRCRKNIVYPLFLKWALNSINVYLQGRFDTIGSTSPHVNISTIINFKIPIPELEEQIEVANYAEKKSNEINVLISKKEQFLTELESYKKSMIYEYVTGKKEVPQS